VTSSAGRRSRLALLGVPLLATAGVCAAGGLAVAVTRPDHLQARPGFEVAGTLRPRALRMVTYREPQRPGPWSRFEAEAGPGWHASWDVATGVPSRIFGPGIPVPGSIADPAVAEAFARAFLARHIELLAPGAAPRDFALAADDHDAGMRTVAFIQRHGGVRVIGGQVSFRFKRDRMFAIGSEALPHVSAAAGLQSIDADRLRATALGWLADAARKPGRGAVEGPFILPLVEPGGVHSYRTVVRVVMDAEQPVGLWHVYLDAATGERVAREQRLRFASGRVDYDAPVRRPGAERRAYPAAGASVVVNGVNRTTGALGNVPWPGDAAAAVRTQVTGPLVDVTNRAGDDATADFDLAPGGTLIWSRAGDELLDAQLTAFIHAGIVKQYARSFAPDLGFLDEQLPVNVNIGEACNAFSDGTSINFFRANELCENTGRLPDVIYHEFGHSLHAHALIEGAGALDVALSEGISDYLAATITSDPGAGRGFFFTGAPLRHLDPENDEAMWPDDVHPLDDHVTGLIIGGALWDLRKALIARLGPGAGVARADHLFYQSIRRAADIPSMYVEVLAADDDDGDLSNGTPSQCEIDQAFARHGLHAIAAEVSPLAAETPTEDGFRVSVGIRGLASHCPLDGVLLAWRLRDTPDRGGRLELGAAGDGSTFEGHIPVQPEGEVVQYRVILSFADGSEMLFPDNPADPRYEFFVGAVEPLYCTDFETDPLAEGWTHRLTSGEPNAGADDWQWGVLDAEPAGGDPRGAFSGHRVLGNDLGHHEDNFDGLYQPGRVNAALSPEIATRDYTSVRLHHRRWLNVQDAFFDRATIYVDDRPVWQNLDTGGRLLGSVHHRDREWRFQDVDLTPYLADGSVQITYELASDAAFQLGGWTLDDFCVVGYDRSTCGDATCERPPAIADDAGGGGCAISGRGNGGLLVALLALVIVWLLRRPDHRCSSPDETSGARPGRPPAESSSSARTRASHPSTESGPMSSVKVCIGTPSRLGPGDAARRNPSRSRPSRWSSASTVHVLTQRRRGRSSRKVRWMSIQQAVWAGDGNSPSRCSTLRSQSAAARSSGRGSSRAQRAATGSRSITWRWSRAATM
jgi:hypothetical protein